MGTLPFWVVPLLGNPGSASAYYIQCLHYSPHCNVRYLLSVGDVVRQTVWLRDVPPPGVVLEPVALGLHQWCTHVLTRTCEQNIHHRLQGLYHPRVIASTL